MFQPEVIQEKSVINLSETNLNDNSLQIEQNIPSPEIPVRVAEPILEAKMPIENNPIIVNYEEKHPI